MPATTDPRRIEFEAKPSLLDSARQEATRRHAAALRLAEVLTEVEAARAYVTEGCASIVEFGGRLGLAAVEVRQLLRMHETTRRLPEIRRAVADGEVSTAAAAALAPIVRRDVLEPEWPDWVEFARSESLHALRKLARRRLAELDAREPLVEVTALVTEETRDGLEAARRVASRRAERTLNLAETIEAVVGHYLKAFHPEWQNERARRVGPTSERPGDRYVPVSVTRELHRRAASRCEFPGCPHRIFLQKAHVRPHSEGSGRELSDLLLLCTRHHTMLDTGLIRVLGTVDAPKFVVPSGRVVAAGHPRGREPANEVERSASRALCRELEADPGPDVSRASGVAERPPPYGGASARDRDRASRPSVSAPVDRRLPLLC